MSASSISRWVYASVFFLSAGVGASAARLHVAMPRSPGEAPDLTVTHERLREISFDPALAGSPEAASAVRALLAGVDPAQLTPEDVVRLSSWDLVASDHAYLEQARPVLEELARATQPAAAGAASVLLLDDLRDANARLMSAAQSGDQEALAAVAADLPDQVARTRAILHMPVFDEAVRAGLMSTFFRGMASFSLRGARDELIAEAPAMQRFLTEDLPLLTLMDMFGVVHMSIQGVHTGALEAAEVEPLKARFVAVLEATKASGDLLPGELMWCEQVEQLLRSGWAQGGSLVGEPAADLRFAWASDASVGSSLADLRGRVVVLDFWATWCTGCRLAIPRLAELQERYADADVTILGVTSLQGQVPTATGWVSTEGDAHAEHEHMAGFMRDEGITWPVVFSDASVFDPRFEVHVLPHLTVVAPDGTIVGSGVQQDELPGLIDQALARPGG